MSINASYLKGLIASAQGSGAELEKLIAPLSSAQLNWKPNAETWSIGEVVDHIITSNRAYFGRLENVVPGAKKAGKLEKAAFKSGWLGKDFIKRMQPGAKKIKTFKVFEPRFSDHSPEILKELQENQEQFREWIEKCRGLDLNRIKIKSPLSGMIRFRLGDALNILVTHQARHTQQAKSVLEIERFPKE